jgi:hypothetical protein
MMRVGINSPQGEIMSDGGIGRFNKLVRHVRDLSNRSKGKETPPSTPRVAKTKEQPHYMNVNLRGEVKIPPLSGASKHADVSSSPPDESPSPSMGDIDRLLVEVEQMPEDPARVIARMIKQLDQVQFDESEENSHADTANSSGSSEKASVDNSDAPKVEPPLTITARRLPPTPSSTTTTTTRSTADKGPKVPPLNLAKKPDTGEEPASTGVGLPDVDAIPEIKAARPSKVRGRAPGTPRMGHKRTDSGQQGPVETPRKMFTHKRTITDRSAPEGRHAPIIGEKTPRTPRVQAQEDRVQPPRWSDARPSGGIAEQPDADRSARPLQSSRKGDVVCLQQGRRIKIGPMSTSTTFLHFLHAWKTIRIF